MPELIGPAGEQEDVSGVSDRDLVLRAVHEGLCIRFELGAMLRELSDMAKRVGRLEDADEAISTRTADHSRRLRMLELRALPAHRRDEEVSSHDWTAELQRASKAAGDQLTARVKDPGEPRFTSERARAIAREESAKLADGRILERWRWSKAWAFRMATEAVKALIIFAAGYLATKVIR